MAEWRGGGGGYGIFWQLSTDIKIRTEFSEPLLVVVVAAVVVDFLGRLSIVAGEETIVACHLTDTLISRLPPRNPLKIPTNPLKPSVDSIQGVSRL